MKLTDIEQLNEAPIGDYETIGDFDRNSSIRDPRDRKIISNPTSIERVKSKFNSTKFNFNLYFVNMPKATHHKEVGEVSEEWVRENLGDDIMDKVGKTDGINIIFTNNSGDQRVPMTAWIMAHRIGHALVRKEGLNQFGKRENHMNNAFNDLVRHTSYILQYAYGFMDRQLPESVMQLSSASRDIQHLYRGFWTSVCTFRSARENKIRDWFEINNELIAQYITTGSINMVDELPERIKIGRSYISKKHNDEIALSEAEELLVQIPEMMEGEYERVLSHASNRIYVM